MIQAARNRIFVEVEHKSIKNITSLMKKVAIENNTSVHLEDYVNIVGTIVSLPKVIDNEKEYKNFSLENIKVGDKAIFSHSVISEMELPNPESDWLHKNRVWYEGRELFAVDITRLFAVIRDNDIIMVNGYVMLTPYTDRKIMLPVHMKKTKGSVTSDVMYIGTPQKNMPQLTLKQGDTVFYNQFKATKYQINNKPFVITQQHHLLGNRVF